MNKKLLSGLAAVGILAGGGSGTALAAAGAPAAAASTVAVASSTSKSPNCGPLGPLVAKGTITQAQALAIRNAFIGYFQDHWRKVLHTVLGQQVRNHTITATQASTVASFIIAWMQKDRDEGPAHHGACDHD